MYKWHLGVAVFTKHLGLFPDMTKLSTKNLIGSLSCKLSNHKWDGKLDLFGGGDGLMDLISGADCHQNCAT